MCRQLVQVLQILGSDTPVEDGAEALGGLGRVLGDVPGHLLGRQFPGITVGTGDVVDVQLRAPAGIPLRPTIDRWARHPDHSHRLPQRLLEQRRREALARRD